MGQGADATLTNLFNFTLRRDAFHPYLISTMVHPSLGQVLIRQGCEASLPNVGLNKFVRVAFAPPPILKANNT